MRGALLAAAAVAAIAVRVSAAAPVEVGIAAAIVGDVRLSQAAAAKAYPIARNQRVAWGDVVGTGKKSLLQILLLDRSNFSIGANTRMTIDRFVYDPSQGRSLFARVFEGAFRFMSGAKNANSTASIDSPIGTIGIRGTALDGVVGEDAVAIAEQEPAVGKRVKSDKTTATLIVLRGPGQATAGGLTVGIADVTAAGRTVTLDQPELAAYIPRPGAPPIGPFRISAGGLSQVQDLLSPSVIAGGGGKGSSLGKILAGAAIVGAGAILLTDHDKHPNSSQQPLGQGKGRKTPAGVPTPAPTSTPGANIRGK
ncbi:MAG TPA: FecR domain-containing protein [Croceibacterium sp.]|nr:FecR domain-containing protein [Croceibacterium sp.]